MDEFLWAFGSMLIVMLIVYFLPLGLTKKGKVIIVFTSFLLGLGGIAANATFSLLLTLLILVVLTLFVTYLMDQRLAKCLYITEDSTSIGEQENDDFFINTKLETAASHEKAYQQKNEATIEPLNLLKEHIEEIPSSVSKLESEPDIQPLETSDEDISFLLNRSISLEKETSEKIEEQKHEEIDYLSEIEELLKDDLDDLQSVSLSSTLQKNEPTSHEDHEIPVISFEDKPQKNKSESSSVSAQKIDDLDEIPVLPFHDKEGDE